MPSTPLRFPAGPDGLAGPAAPLGDTERPPAAPFEAEPGSGVGPVPSSNANRTATRVRPPTGTLVYGPEIDPAALSAPGTLPVAIVPPGVQVDLPAPAAPDALTRYCTTCSERYPADFLVCPRDATPLTDEGPEGKDPLIGKLLGETYQIVRVVGEGGMGRVYEARHLRLKERRFAVKVLHPDLAKSTEMAARFMREAEMASSFTHPNVVDVFDVHHLPDGVPYFVGEFLEGEELADWVQQRGPLTPRLAAALLEQVASGVAAAHLRGIIHRDIKPENIFVSRSDTGEMRAKLLDFGIGKSGSVERTHLTRTGVIMGTPSYMAPEQARGRPVDHRADVYALGAVLYYALTGKKPFDADDPTSTLSMVLTQDPQRPREIDPSIPEAMELVVQRAMAKDPGDRFQTMSELGRALKDLESGPRAPTTLAAPAHELTGASRAFDFAAAVFGSTAIDKTTLARPTIIAASVVLGAFVIGTLVSALGGLVRVLHNDAELTTTECLMLVVGALFAASTPGLLYVLQLRKHVWPNSVRANELAEDLRKAALAALVTYGALAILSRVSHTILWRSSRGLSNGTWDLALFSLSSLAGILAFGAGPVVRAMRKRGRA